MTWIMMVFFCVGEACYNIETTAYHRLDLCEHDIDVAIDAITREPDITFFQVRCEPNQHN